MKPILMTTALLSTLATALPTATILEPLEVRAAAHVAPSLESVPVQGDNHIDAHAPAALSARTALDARDPLGARDAFDTRDARAATIYKSTNAVGESTFIPANNYCTNISVVPGGFDRKIKSLSVEKGRKCDFYKEEGCGVNDFTGGGAVLEIGSRKYKDVRRRLGSWEGRIASVYCQII